MTLRRQVFGPRSAEVASSLAALAWVLDDQAQYPEAERMAREALALRRSLFGNEHVDVARSLTDLAWILAEEGDDAKAEAMQRESVRILKKLLGDAHPDVALESRAGVEGDAREVGEQVVALYTGWGKPVQAAEWRKRVAETTAQKGP